MAGIEIKVTLDQTKLRRFKKVIDEMLGVARGRSARRRLHQQFGISTLQWIDRNFRAGGGLTGSKWKRLSENTVAGRRRGSNRPLQDTGQLRQSFTAQVRANGVRVGTDKEYASFHEFGTGPYPITPRQAQFLMFQVAKPGQGDLFRKRPTKVKFSFSSIASKKTFKKGAFVVFAKEVMHPGLAKRRMLPNEAEINPIIERVANRFMNTVLKRAGETPKGSIQGRLF